MENTHAAKPAFDIEAAVADRYGRGAREPQTNLCSAVAYDPKVLEAIPEEVIERDYGCGDPTRDVREGETVLDLGSGSGKVCFIASQKVGPRGRVIGVDLNDEMLALARRAAPQVARRIGYGNVEFRKGRIQDLSLDLEALDGWLREHPVRGEADWRRVEAKIAELRRERPLVPDESVDVVLSNCVLNLVAPEHKRRLFAEIHRVLRRGGRAVVSDIVSDEEVPERLRQDPDLWSGCISGAMREDEFLDAFAEAGLYGVHLVARAENPWRVVEGIEFRSVTVAAFKGKEGPCLDGKHAVIYRGPFRRVEDDDGHALERGVRVAVCEKTFGIFSREPYREHVVLVAPNEPVPADAMRPFPCTKGALRRHPRETKGEGYRETTQASGSACESGNGSARCC